MKIRDVYSSGENESRAVLSPVTSRQNLAHTGIAREEVLSGEMMRNGNFLAPSRHQKIWVDLDNSPHVPFFVPIIEELRKRGFTVLVTARDCFQVCELADLHGVQYRRIGRHYGKSKVLKLAGLCARTLQLAPTMVRERPDVALSHGSRSQVLLAAILGVPSVVVLDYEFAKGLRGLHPDWMMFPDILAGGGIKGNVMMYPGIKEDVYVPRFRPDAGVRADLGLGAQDLVVTVRPPANEAHYHNPESDALLHAVFALLGGHPDTKIILLPRNQKQEMSIRKSWPALFSTNKIVVPDHAVDGLNLIWNSDLVISGGGTMNREAAALGVPVYSIFRGKIGAVDRYLESSGRLVLVESIADVRTKIVLRRKHWMSEPGKGNNRALQKIVDHVVTIAESLHPAPMQNTNHYGLMDFPADLNLCKLSQQAIDALVPMFNAERQLFCHRLRQNELGLVQEGLSQRYTLMTLLGLQRGERAGLRSPIDIKSVLDALSNDTTWINNLGDLGLLLWTCACVAPERLKGLWARIDPTTAFNESREVRECRTMELAWFLSGLAHAGLALPNEFGDLTDLPYRSFELLHQNQGKQGIFGHRSNSGTVSGYMRGRIGSFADQVYPIYAMSKFGQAYGVQKALDAAKNCADAICRVQGPLGQWWWHYDAATGRVVERYPVYSVHQEGMAPMALLALEAAAGLDYKEPIYRGLRWIAGNNELRHDLRHPSGLVWRCLLHKTKHQMYWERMQLLLGSRSERQGRADVKILHECRPYELGWLLYAFAGLQSVEIRRELLGTVTPH